MGKITPHLWFDKQAKEAADFYVETFGENSKITNFQVIHDTPSGDAETVSFEIWGFPFIAISAGPLFKFNPSISFHVICEDPNKVDELWKKLSVGGTTLMELGEYPFSKRYGWLADKYGLSWQIIYFEKALSRQKITPVLMYTQEMAGKAEEAITVYTKTFGGNIEMINRYEKGELDVTGTIKYAQIKLFDTSFGAMDSSAPHAFKFNEAVSLLVSCKDQAEIDKYWKDLSFFPEAEQCGWLKDKYGVSWQIVPEILGELMSRGTPEQTQRVTQAFLQMKKFEIDKLEKAFEGD